MLFCMAKRYFSQKKKKKAKVKKPYNKIHWAKVTQQRTGRCFAEWDVLINRGVLQVRYLWGSGCPPPVSGINCHQVVVLGKGVIVLQHCDLHLDRSMALGGLCLVGSSTAQQPRVSWAFMAIKGGKQNSVCYWFILSGENCSLQQQGFKWKPKLLK